eukprot:TRINITY_DN26008_c0_g1_i2.p1 TRINITY_DN26008_c0_g1~~TRINITY_DN26008_c0_g1_i2.p1  ORF type:complete len:716 (+),score=191.71 TRINITY_DN26008_c0_g1_i2:260-2149(+)
MPFSLPKGPDLLPAVRSASYRGLLEWYSRRTSFERPGSRDLRFGHFVMARNAPPPDRVFRDLDAAGWLWTDYDLADVVRSVQSHANVRPLYWEEGGLELVTEVSQLPSAIGLRTKRELVQAFAAAGYEAEAKKTLSDLKAMRAERGQDEDPGDDAALLHGSAAAGDTETALAVFVALREAGHVDHASKALPAMLSAFAVSGDTVGLERMFPYASAGSVHGSCWGCVNACLAAGKVDMALGYAELGANQGDMLRGSSDWKRTRKEYDLRGQLCGAVKTRAQAEKALELLRLWLASEDTPLPSLDVRSAYDVLIGAALDADAVDVAFAAFAAVERVNRQLRRKAGLHRTMLPVLPEVCHRLLAAAALEEPFREAEVTALLRHMRTTRQPTSFAALLHLQAAVEATWSSAGAVAMEVLAFCPNVDDRLLYYLPGWQHVRLTRPACATPAGLRELFGRYTDVNVVTAAWLLQHAAGLPALLKDCLPGEVYVLLGSVLGSLQVAGDESREQGMADNPADQALRSAAACFSAKHAPAAVHSDLLSASPLPLHVFGPVEQRLASAGSSGGLSPSSDADRLAAFALAADAAVDRTAFRVLAAPDEEALPRLRPPVAPQPAPRAGDAPGILRPRRHRP